MSLHYKNAGGIGGMLARTETKAGAAASIYYRSDNVGNVTALIDTNQNAVARYHYEPFGSMIASSGPLADENLYRFSTKESHDQSGSVYFLYRYYLPCNQKWVTRDPIGEVETPNLYCFVINSPTRNFDAVGYAGTLIPCKPNDEKAIRATLRDACDKFNDPNRCQLGCLAKAIGQKEAEKGLDKIRNFCNKFIIPGTAKVLCDYTGATGDCKNNVAWGDGKDGIVFCPQYFQGKGPYTKDCVAIHEIAHWGWEKLDNASEYDKCFGCPGKAH